ncbi:MAG: choice-of-anchor L domain-containing protein [Bacteroidia bacterium]
MKKIIIAAVLFTIIFLPFQNYAQITADTTYTPLQLAMSLAGPGVVVTNVTYIGSSGSRAMFTSNGILPADSGVFLTNGKSLWLDFPSTQNLSFDAQLPGDADLANYLGAPLANMYDATALEFDMYVMTGDSFELKFFFASEEYNDYVNTLFYDGFAVFVDGQNIAVIPGTTSPITISTINNGQSPPGTPATGPCEYCNLYVDNWNGSNFSFDGYTTLITAKGASIPGQPYHVKIVIADLYDHLFDTGVFLKGGSLQATGGINPCAGFTVDATPEDSTVCQNTVQLNATASTTTVLYNWTPSAGLSDPNIPNPVVNFAYHQQYVVTVTDTVTGCVATDTVLITALSNFSQIAYNCGNFTYDLFLPDSATSYYWFSYIDTANVPHPLTDTTQFIVVSEPGTYAGTANFPGCSINGYFELIDTCSATPRVWPGDCNYDLVVNNVDFLYLGLANLFIGPGRTPYSIAWQPFFCNNWQNVFANGINYKHADCNGDGAVEIIDTLAISQNYGLTHPFRLAPPQNYSVNFDLKLIANKDTAWQNEWISFDLVAGTPSLPVNLLYGIAFTLNFDNILLDNSQTAISYSSSVLGTLNSDMYFMTKDFSASGIIDAALCRFDQLNVVNVNGVLGTIYVKTAGNISSVQTLHFNLSNVFAITVFESPVLFNLIGDSVIIMPGTLGTVELNSQTGNVSIAPNPFSKTCEISFSISKKQHVKLEIYDGSGKQVMILQDGFLNEGKHNYLLNAKQTGSGVYYLKLTTADFTETRKIVAGR